MESSSFLTCNAQIVNHFHIFWSRTQFLMTIEIYTMLFLQGLSGALIMMHPMLRSWLLVRPMQ